MKTIVKVALVLVLIYWISSVCSNNDSSPTTETQIESSVIENKAEIITYEILRKWNPKNDKKAVGLDVLITKEDATEESIIDLVKHLAPNNVLVANVIIFTSRSSWVDLRNGSDFNDDMRKNYVAYYVKNISTDGAFTGFNEIRWMQGIGEFSDLPTTKF